MRRAFATAAGVLLVAASSILAQSSQAPRQPTLPRFTDVTGKSGITFTRSFGDRTLSNIVEGTGSGACAFDYDNDGRLDLYFPQGRWDRAISDNQSRDLIGQLRNALYRGGGDLTFQDVTEKAGVAGRSFAFGCSAADYDNDGDVDLMVLTYRGPELYRNGGDGTFTEVTADAGLADTRWALNAAWLDYDRDGHLDVFVANYLEYDEGKFRSFYAAAGYPGPLSYNGVSNTLYHNNGNGTFTDVSEKAGVYRPGGRAMSAVAADVNDDGWTDLYVANDSMENYYFENRRDGTFSERASEVGLAFGQNGQGVSSMGPTVADLDGDGNLEILVPDMDYGSLLAREDDFFVDVIDSSGLAVICGQYTGWGAVLLDYDNDGHQDVFIANGNAHHEYAEDAVLARNTGKGVFVDVSRASGDFFHTKWVGRGATWADFDDDGNVDLVVVDTSGPPHVLRNGGGTGNHWLKIDARVKGGTRTAIGARVVVAAGGHTQTQDLIGVNGYLSQGDTRVHFGLGSAATADSVRVRWPDGSVDEWKDVKADQVLRLEQGKQ